ncbi:hypothetical protein BH11ACT8_BH11ACT8_28300 [soil metagenome]
MVPGRYEQVWTRTTDRLHVELCSIPFVTHGRALGDRPTISEDGSRTRRGRVMTELYGHATACSAVNIADQDEADA